MNIEIYRGNIVYSESQEKMAEHRKSFIIVRDGIVEDICPVLPEKYAECPVTDFGDDVIIPAFSDLHVVFQKITHQAAKWNNLDFPIFIVAKYHSHGTKINVFILDIPDSRCSASAVQQKINDDPISVFGKRTVLFRPFKEPF